METTITLGKTLPGDDRVNHLRLTPFRVVRLWLEAGEKKSRSHSRSSATSEGDDSFYFLPAHETVRLAYEVDDPFGIVDGGQLQLFTRFEEQPLWTLDLAKLGRDWWTHGVHTIVWDGRVVAESVQDGTPTEGGFQHDLTKFEPRRDPESPFPDGYTTLEWTPYKLVLTLTSGGAGFGRPPTAWTYYHVLIKRLELELGTEAMLPTDDGKQHERDKAVLARLHEDGGLPASGETRRIPLVSNIFERKSAEMQDDTAFTTYEETWGNGPRIPIVARVHMLDSADNEVDVESGAGAAAIGRVAFLWNWEDPQEDIEAQQRQEQPKTFLSEAIDYYKDATDASRADADHTYPQGDNCHVDRGGKRGPEAAPVFPAQRGMAPSDETPEGAFPFEVTGSEGRPWAAISRAWTSGALKGQTGVLFQPSRMAGDDYVVTCYLAYDRQRRDGKVALILDTNAEPIVAHAQIQASTGKFQIWREVHLVRYIRKTELIEAFLPDNLSSVRKPFEEAYLDLRSTIGDQDSYVWAKHRNAAGHRIDYNRACREVLARRTEEILKYAIDPDADHASVSSAFLSRDYVAFVKAVHKQHNERLTIRDLRSAARELNSSLAQFCKTLGSDKMELNLDERKPARNARLARTRAELRDMGVPNEEIYMAALETALTQSLIELAGSKLHLIQGGKLQTVQAAVGITVFHVDYSNTAVREFHKTHPTKTTAGAAINAADGDREHCVFILARPANDTFIHEIGHLLFLPHAANRPPKESESFDSIRRHDHTDEQCIMSYNRPRTHFCGLCQLRMRGWKASALLRFSSRNQKT